MKNPFQGKKIKEKITHDILKDDHRPIKLGEMSNTRMIITIAIIFILYLIFNADSSLRSIFSTHAKINEYKKEIKELKKEIAQDSIIIDGIKNDREYLIKYSREKLFMKLKNEEVYIIE